MNKPINIFKSNRIKKSKEHKFYKVGINSNKIYLNFFKIKIMKNNNYKFNKLRNYNLNQLKEIKISIKIKLIKKIFKMMSNLN